MLAFHELTPRFKKFGVLRSFTYESNPNRPFSKNVYEIFKIPNT